MYVQLISSKKVLGVYTLSTETIYLSLRAQAAGGTFFMKTPVLNTPDPSLVRPLVQGDGIPKRNEKEQSKSGFPHNDKQKDRLSHLQRSVA